jgi:hypothetical protein
LESLLHEVRQNPSLKARSKLHRGEVPPPLLAM